MKINNDSNITPALTLMALSIPTEATTLEKLRWIYLTLGKLFSYDYRVIGDESVILNKIDYNSEYIGRYQTCYQISDIFCHFVKYLIPEVQAKVIPRRIPGRSFIQDHVAVEINIPQEDTKFLMDLTLDLANIQAGLRTKHFGFETAANTNYDIIPLCDCKEMDQKLGFILDKYTDDDIDNFKDKMNKVDFSGMSKSEIIDFKIRSAKEELLKTFVGHHEATTYVNTVLSDILSPLEKRSLKQSNLFYINNDNEFNVVSIYSFNENNLYYCYSNDIGFNPISPDAIQDLLDRGWKTNSTTLQSILNGSEVNKQSYK